MNKGRNQQRRGRYVLVKIRDEEYEPRQNSPAVGLERRRGEEREDVARWEWIALMRRRAAEEESIINFPNRNQQSERIDENDPKIKGARFSNFVDVAIR